VEGLGIDVVAEQDRGLDAVHRVHRRDAAAQGRPVEDVVVHQGRRVQQFDHLRDLDVCVGQSGGVRLAAHRHAREEHHRRSQLLAAVAGGEVHHRVHLAMPRGEIDDEFAVQTLELRADQ
jgi:hypothetical protein